MDALTVSRLQFATTTIYHFFFVPLTLGLAVLVAIMETMYVRTGDEVYKKMTKFWGKLFLINFAMGVVTGIVMEFQFGMNWSEYSRFVGDVFGAPLAIEGLSAFFLESTFLGVWIFGWDRLPKGVHAAVMWAVAIGSNLSALWILVANSFMQEPVGYALNNGRAEMVDFWALLGNPHVWQQFPHVVLAGITTGSFFMLGVAAYHLVKKSSSHEVWRRSFLMAAIAGLVGSVLVGVVGHSQGQHMFKTQPMKMAAAEALWETEKPADLSLFTISDQKARKEVFAIKLPAMMSLLNCNNFTCEIPGINEIQAEYEQTYGPGNYIPPVTLVFWSFRAMVGAGLAMIALAAAALFLTLKKWLDRYPWLLRLLIWAIPLPYIANTGGWLLAEVGRQPWIVFGLMRTEQGVSVSVSGGMVIFSLLAFVLLYGVLMAADVYLLAKYARKGVPAEAESASSVDEQSSALAAAN
ncbi:MAG: cytochrome ubiquinol oxidase subunit I [Anaerolineae bacterium]|jgi:cytochrome d ubiquinol oxidase subunit I